jgi:hypothetical protein
MALHVITGLEKVKMLTESLEKSHIFYFSDIPMEMPETRATTKHTNRYSPIALLCTFQTLL